MESNNVSELRATIEQNGIGARSPTYLCGMLDDLDATFRHCVLYSKVETYHVALSAVFRRRT